MKQIPLLFSLILSLTPVTAFSAADTLSGGSVEAMQMPAWYDRDGQSYPLKPGTKLFSGDIVRTGNSARALLRMEEGSLIKLGEGAKLNFTTLKPAAKKEGVFAALLNVARGAFRFTTTSLGKNRKRNIDVKIGAITAGIRGTDIWGSANTEKDILCLIEGEISAQRDGEAAFPMTDPLSFYIVPKDKPALPVAPVPEAKLAKWAEETETQQGWGLLTTEGKWAVNLMSLQNASAASKQQQQLNEAGYATQIQKTVINEQSWLRLRIEGFSTREDATRFANTIDSQYGIQQPWVVKF